MKLNFNHWLCPMDLFKTNVVKHEKRERRNKAIL